MAESAKPFSKLNELISRGSDIFVAASVLMIIVLLVIRVDQTVMDWLIAINISIAALVLLTVLYIPDPRRVPSFPTLLLLTTLFRLGLNVSTTRLILLEADAGEIIDTFGQFVVAGNFVVGAVVFLVLVVIQFVVIAQGAERVATVSARFTLDSLPGKQSVIEQDMAAGRISPERGQRERAALDRESKLYGAMDGAMKFVKGDAIAGIIISLVNVVGGLVVGVLQQGMDVGEAAQVYTLLTVGDGLVSQIPALLLSVSAGLVVTRVAAEMDTDKPGSTNIGRDIIEQILSQKRALLLLAVLLLMVTASSVLFNTGFPIVPFLALTGIAAALYFVRRQIPDE
ncbi:MAG: FHIPEP family type III secretion protein, partial [Planctomycetota bacterium]